MPTSKPIAWGDGTSSNLRHILTCWLLVILQGPRARVPKSKLKYRIEIGDRFGRLEVVEKTSKRTAKGDVLWKCACDCGASKLAKASHLGRGQVKSCGCLHRELAQDWGKARLIDLVGRKFGRLTVVRRSGSQSPPKWLCWCECGHVATVRGGYLKNGTTRSCGCLAREESKFLLENTFRKKGRLTSRPVPF